MGVLGIIKGEGEGKGVQGCQISKGAKSLGGPKARHLVLGYLMALLLGNDRLFLVWMHKS